MPDTSIRLNVHTATEDPGQPEFSGNLLQITATGTEIDDEIFVHQLDVGSEFSPDTDLALFYSVASVAQMEEFPAGNGNADQPFFRLNTLELVFERVDELDAFVEQLKGDVVLLERANDVVINDRFASDYDIVVEGGIATEGEVGFTP